MERSRVNIAVGIFVVLGVLALGYLSVRLGKVTIFSAGDYLITADFPTIAGLKKGATVEIAGVSVGRVERIALVDYQARVTMRIDAGVKLQDDAIASIKTKGLIGEKYVRISPGGSDTLIAPGGRLRDVEAPVDLEELISKYIFGKV